MVFEMIFTQSFQDFNKKWNKLKYFDLLVFQRSVRLVVRHTLNLGDNKLFVKVTQSGNKQQFFNIICGTKAEKSGQYIDSYTLLLGSYGIIFYFIFFHLYLMRLFF